MRGGRLLRSELIAVTGPTIMLLDSGFVPGKQAFVPVQGARGEDEGWLPLIVAHQTPDAARFLVLDATR